MSEAITYSTGQQIDWTPTAAVAAGEIVQLPDGRAAYAPTAIDAGVKGAVQVSGIVTVLKDILQVMLKGTKVYWDHSDSTVDVTFGANTRDFYVGVVQESTTATATTAKVLLNVEPTKTLSLGDGFWSVPVSTAGWPHVVGHREGASLIFDLAAEAQKLDALSTRGIAVGTDAVVHALICINENGDDAAFDLNVGLANATHATDADSITESLFVHVDGASLNILAESDDGTTEVAATDTTVDAVVGTPFLVQWDITNLADIQMYIDGVNVLPNSTFKLNVATGPLKLLAHMEKTANDSPGNVTVMELFATTFDV